jgi:tripartite-type tricarboxylate transporter receptor subunit TctC
VLVTTAPARVPALPDTPAIAELGTKDLTFIGWFGLLTAAGTPSDILDQLNGAKAISQTAAFRERMQKIHVEAVGDSPAEFRALINAESEKLGALIRKIDINVEQ